MIIESNSTVPARVRDAPKPALKIGLFSMQLTAATTASSTADFGKKYFFYFNMRYILCFNQAGHGVDKRPPRFSK